MPKKVQEVKEVKVVQGEEPMPVEILAEHIKAISEGVKKLVNGPLNEKAIVLLIQNAAPSLQHGQKISATEVRAVLAGLESLERTYLRRKG